MAPAPWLAMAGVIVAVAGCARSTPASSSDAASAAAGTPRRVRPPAVAGQFYPGDPQALANAVNDYLASAAASTPSLRLIALIAPHAGYDYSGKVAGQAYRALKGRAISTVVIVGPSHRARFEGAALCSADAWETPLGMVPADQELIAALEKHDAFAIRDGPHGPEHCIEVQLPFLQRALGEFRLAAVLMSDFSRHNCARVAANLVEELKGRSAVLVASSDMSHYPSYDDACKADGEMLEAVRSLDSERVLAKDAELLGRRTPGLGCTLCGLGPVVAVMEAAKRLGAERVEVLSYANSGDAKPRDRGRVVGYCAVAIYGKEAASMSEKPADKAPEPQDVELDEERQRKLLRLARRTIEEYVRHGRVLEVTEDDPVLTQPRGVFVTLRRKGMLRGCIGDLEGAKPLYRNVRDKAIASAANDFRFEPVSAAELNDLHIEISVLSPMRRVTDPSEIVAGKHGVLVSQGNRAGVYLPQVAAEQGWTREQMLTHLCQHKAGLAPDAWRKGAELHSFTAQVFGEEQFGE